jgi:hypothetical protein
MRRHFIVVEPNLAWTSIVVADTPSEAAQTYGCARSLGGSWVAVQPLSGVACERDAKWERYELVGPECEPTEGGCCT